MNASLGSLFWPPLETVNVKVDVKFINGPGDAPGAAQLHASKLTSHGKMDDRELTSAGAAPRSVLTHQNCGNKLKSLN